MDGPDRFRRRAAGRAATAGLLLALVATACNPRAVRGPATTPTVGASDPAPAQPAPATFPDADTIEGVIDGGWITVSVTLPRHPDGPKPVVISPIVAERDLLERGIGFVRFRTHWEILKPLADAVRAKASSPANAAGPGDTGRALASGTGAPAAATGASDAPTPPGATPAEPQVGAWLLAAPRPGIVGRAYFQLITQDAHASIPRVVDFLAAMPQVDPTRIAIGGSSTSGFVALQALAAEPRLSAAVVRVACGDYTAFLRSSRLALNDDPRWVGDGPLPLDRDYV
ncbi:MAG: alpha/beta hydrolase family protein, partial [Alphaproteobacteria bacterium]